MKNRLANEKSPYLLQHADNPVDWYPWGEEAFAKAAREDKPIFLSIGYSTCHWCHVMENESFEDPEVGALMNKTFVSIKVDREERPDVDGVYMKVSQMMTGRGGWPLTIIMTPDKKPFFAATYIPKESRYNMMGLVDLIGRVDELWHKEKGKITKSAEAVFKELNAAGENEAGGAIGPHMLTKGFEQLKKMYDPEYGGFAQAPKFPAPHNLLFLLRYWKQTGDGAALEMVGTTLSAMSKGGIHDHVGGGFHRYSTDRVWLTPHFEKMLYDQAMLAMAYTEAYSATGRTEYRQTAEDILRYVLRDMRSPEGGFYTAEDADSEGEEGKFYLWSYGELEKILTPEDFTYIKERFDISPQGNAGDEVTGTDRGLIILSEKDLTAPGGKANRLANDDQKFSTIRQTLFTEREKRVHPLKDTKILTDWNGLMISALAKAARTFENKDYRVAAERAARFLLSSAAGKDGTLLHRYKDGGADIPGYLTDYAFLSWGLVELYEAGFDPFYLRKADELARYMLDHFRDEKGYGLYLTSDLGEKLLVREKEIYDGAIPSGNSAAMYSLLEISRLTGKTDLETRAEKIGRAFSSSVTKYPAGHTFLLSAFSFITAGPKEVVVIGKPGAPDTNALLQVLTKGFYPEAVLIFIPDGEDSAAIRSLAPYTEGFSTINGKATAYVCSNYRCQLPTNDPVQMEENIRN